MVKRILLFAVVSACWLAAPATTLAGGWALTTISSTPDGTAPGEPWVVDVEVLQHGVSPAIGLEPIVAVTGPGDQRESFAARPTGEPGVYRARVEFPAEGRWTYVVETGFGDTLTFPPVEIAAAPAASAAAEQADPGRPWWVVAGAVLAGLLATAGVWRFAPRRPEAAMPAAG